MNGVYIMPTFKAIVLFVAILLVNVGFLLFIPPVIFLNVYM